MSSPSFVGNARFPGLFLRFRASVSQLSHAYSFVDVAALCILPTQFEILKQIGSEENITVNIPIVVAVEELGSFHEHTADDGHLVRIQTTLSLFQAHTGNPSPL